VIVEDVRLHESIEWTDVASGDNPMCIMEAGNDQYHHRILDEKDESQQASFHPVGPFLGISWCHWFVKLLSDIGG
jgi:hypothetical protein